VTQQCSDPPQAAIIPKAYAPVIPGFVTYLSARYPMRETTKFLVFDLRQSK
jgi:hypothetical protein